MITVLGGAGFIGRRLIAAIEGSGRNVFVPARGDASIYSQDLGDVYYCVGKTANFADDPVATYEAHVDLLVRILSKATFNRIIYLSSTRLYDGLPAGMESAMLHLSPTQQRHLYDLTKALGEHFACLHSAGRGCVARLACVYDATSDANGFLPELLRRIATEDRMELRSSPRAARDYVHVDDVVSALQLIMSVGAPSQIYNVASGENVSNAEIGALLDGHGKSVAFTDTDSVPPPAPCVSNEKMRALGWQPRTLSSFIRNYLVGQ